MGFSLSVGTRAEYLCAEGRVKREWRGCHNDCLPLRSRYSGRLHSRRVVSLGNLLDLLQVLINYLGALLWYTERRLTRLRTKIARCLRSFASGPRKNASRGFTRAMGSPVRPRAWTPFFFPIR